MKKVKSLETRVAVERAVFKPQKRAYNFIIAFIIMAGVFLIFANKSDAYLVASKTVVNHFKVASETNLISGANFRSAVTSLVGDTTSVKKFIYYDGTPNLSNLTTSVISLSDQEYPVYIWFDSTSGTLFYWTEAKIIYLNRSSSTMFQGFNNIEEIDTDKFNTSKVATFAKMFYECYKLKSVDLSNFKTDIATNFEGIFYKCQALQSIDISSFNTENVTNMKNAFRELSSLQSLDISGLDTKSVTNMEYTFYGYKGAVLDVSNLNTEKVTNMKGTFGQCSNIQSLDLSNFNTKKVTTMQAMFANCTNLRSLDLSSFSPVLVTTTENMFTNDSNLDSIIMPSFNTVKTTSMKGMFSGCSALQILDLSSFNTSNVTNMQDMFNSCSSLKSVNLSSFDTSSVTTMYGMFAVCNSLESVDLSNFSTTLVTNMNSMFNGCMKLSELDLSRFDTGNVTDMGYMFYNDSLIESVYVGADWSVTNVTKSTSMFNGCTSIVGGAGTVYDSSKIDKTYAHVDGGTLNPGYFNLLTVAGIKDINYGQYVDIGTNILNKSSVTLEGGEHPAADWRVFLKDSGGVWLILADYMPNSAFDVSTVGLQIGDGANGTEYGVRSTTSRDALINGLNNSNWANLISGSDVAGKAGVTVKGALTIEEWTQSWNACNSGSYPQLTPVYYPTSVADVANTTGYKIKGGYGTDPDSTTETPDTEYYSTYVRRGGGYENALYFPHKSYSNVNGGTNDIRAYWLASPSAYIASGVMGVYYYGGVSRYAHYYADYGVRPAVYLPSDIQLDRSRADYWSIR